MPLNQIQASLRHSGIDSIFVDVSFLSQLLSIFVIYHYHNALKSSQTTQQDKNRKTYNRNIYSRRKANLS